MRRRSDRAGTAPCWKGRGDPTPFEPGVPATVHPAPTLNELFGRMQCCTRCDLAAGRTMVVPGFGPASAAAMLIGEGPGADEDRRGVPFVGRAGRLLDTILADAGLDRADLFITNVVACRPPGNRTPRAREVAAHAPWLEEQIRLVQPRVIATLGRAALTYFVPGAKITAEHGKPRPITHQGRGITILPTFHPAAALRRRELIPALRADFAGLAALIAASRDRRRSR